MVGFRQRVGMKRCFPEEIAYAVLFCSYGGNYDCSVPESPSPLFFSRYGSVLYAVPFPGAGPCVFQAGFAGNTPGASGGVPVVPQLLTKYPEDFIWAAGELGCNGVPGGQPEPAAVWDSGGKGKGWACWRIWSSWSAFWIRFFLHVRHFTFRLKPGWGFPARILFPSFWSCTTGTDLGVDCASPGAEGLYKHEIRWQAFAYAAACSKNPLCYNGDLRTAEDCQRLEREMPSLSAAMIGRGLVADPAMVTRLQGGTFPDGRCMEGLS